jgi:hypothetical protein
MSKDSKPKPRVRFCWHCGKRLWGNHYEERKIEGHKKILHKKCWKEILEKGEYEQR